MRAAAFLIGLIFISYKVTDGTKTKGVQWLCQDRYLWIHVPSLSMPQFEAVDENGVHSITEQLASLCGYTISSFKMDGFTTFRASYYSCFTHRQNDDTFTFRFNVIVSDIGGGWINQPVSAVCSGRSWTHRELICEEEYMEVNVNRDSSCGAQRGESGELWQAAFAQAQRTASTAWQLMFLQSDGQVSAMSVTEAQRQGYSLTTTARRVVLRSRYNPPHAKLMLVDGIRVVVVQVSLFFKQKLVVMMMDLSMACPVNLGSFDGTHLLWDIPHVMTPLVGEGPTFETKSLSLGVEGVLLDQQTASARGFSLVQQGSLVQIKVPFGAEGGYRKSSVVNGVYKEMYVIFLLYEHVFSLLYEDGSSIDTRHRLLRVLNTPLICQPPFSLDQTAGDDQMFKIYLGNIPADVILEDILVNGKPLLTSDTPERGIDISSVLHNNGSQAYKLRLPFEDPAVQWTYLGEGMVQYSIDMNSTLTIMPQRESYYHHTVATAKVLNAFPPEITAQCSDRGITFSVGRSPRSESLWEVGIDQEPLTSELAAQRGYILHSDNEKTILEVPAFSIGYTYEGINLLTFYGTFKLLLRDARTLEVQTSTSKHCLFKTEDMIVCSPDGIITVVTTPTVTWPKVQPEKTSLLDPSCGPKQTDKSRVLFEFNVNSCGTRTMVGDSYVVYENEILHDRQLIADGPNFISRESQFKLTVRCFYPLNAIHRLSVNRLFRSEIPGFGSIKVFQSLKDPTNKFSTQDCLQQGPGNAQSKQVLQMPYTQATVPLQPGIGLPPKPGPRSFITVPESHDKMVPSSPNPQTLPDSKLSLHNEIPLQVSAHPGPLTSQTKDLNMFSSQIDDSKFAKKYEQIPDGSDESQLRTPPVVDQLLPSWGSAAQTPTVRSLNSWGDVWRSGQTLDQLTVGQKGNLKPSSGMQEESQPHEADPTQYEPSPKPQRYGIQTPAHYSKEPINSVKLQLPGTYSAYVPTYEATRMTADKSGDGLRASLHLRMGANETKVHQNVERTGSVERRNVKPIQSRVQNIKVKPLRKLASSGHHLGQKSSIQPADLQSSGPFLSHTSETPGALRQEHGVHNFRLKPDAIAVSPVPDLSQKWQGIQRLTQSVAETENAGQQSASQHKVLQPAGASHVRVRPAPSLSRRLQTPEQLRPHNLDSVTSKNIPKSSLDKYKSTITETSSPDSYTGSGDSGSDLTSHTRPECNGLHGVSIHNGIRRGTNTSDLYT